MHREKKQRESVIFPRRCKIQKIPLKNRFWIDFWMEVGGIEIGLTAPSVTPQKFDFCRFPSASYLRRLSRR